MRQKLLVVPLRERFKPRALASGFGLDYHPKRNGIGDLLKD
jgi:hypothetical protein